MVKEEIERFRNTTNFSGREVTDFNKATLKPTFIKLGIAVFALFMLIGVYMLVVGNGWVYACVFFAFGVISAVIMPFLYKSVVKRSAKKNVMCSASTYLDYKFTDGGFYVRTLKGEIEVANQSVDYRWIDRVVESGHYLYIFITSSMCYILDKYGMTSGKSEQLKEFFASKNVKIVSKNNSKVQPRKSAENNSENVDSKPTGVLDAKTRETETSKTNTNSESGVLGLVDENTLSEGSNNQNNIKSGTLDKSTEILATEKKTEDKNKDNELQNAKSSKPERKIEKLVIKKVTQNELSNEEQKRKNALDKMTK